MSLFTTSIVISLCFWIFHGHDLKHNIADCINNECVEELPVDFSVAGKITFTILFAVVTSTFLLVVHFLIFRLKRKHHHKN